MKSGSRTRLCTGRKRIGGDRLGRVVHWPVYSWASPVMLVSFLLLLELVCCVNGGVSERGFRRVRWEMLGDAQAGAPMPIKLDINK